jgi:hypothetical protein
MNHFYKNIIYATAVFLLVVLMHVLRCESLPLGQLLSLGLMFAGGMVAGVLGNSLVTHTK